jgi:type IV pilus biogenesis protein CpaD/CtpE
MNIRDIINPWGALRRERTNASNTLEALAARYSLAARSRIEIGQRLSDANNTAAYNLGESLRHSAEATRLSRIVATGHFRNPATGRLGKRGETFE